MARECRGVPPGPRGRATEPGPAAEYRGEHLRLAGERGRAERVNAAVPRMERATLDLFRDPSARQPRGEELAMREEVLLARREGLECGGVSDQAELSVPGLNTPPSSSHSL